MAGQHKFKFWAFSTDSRSSLSMAASIGRDRWFFVFQHPPTQHPFHPCKVLGPQVSHAAFADFDLFFACVDRL